MNTAKQTFTVTAEDLAYAMRHANETFSLKDQAADLLHFAESEAARRERRVIPQRLAAGFPQR